MRTTRVFASVHGYTDATWQEEADRRMMRGEAQQQCPSCKGWIFPRWAEEVRWHNERCEVPMTLKTVTVMIRAETLEAFLEDRKLVLLRQISEQVESSFEQLRIALLRSLAIQQDDADEPASLTLTIVRDDGPAEPGEGGTRDG